MPLIFGSKEANEQLARDNKTWAFYAQLVGEMPSPHEAANEADDAQERYCPTCRGYMDWVDCWQCGGKGGRDGDDLMDEDPLWYDEDDWEDCDVCEGKGGYWECASLPHDDAGAE